MRGVRLLRHPRNRGYGAAIRTACQAASRPYVVWFDADGQHGAEMVAALLANLPDCDCVIGARTGKSPLSWLRRGGVAAICWLARLLTLRRIPDLNCGLRAFRLDLLRRYLDLLPEGFSASATTTIVMLELGHRVAWTPIPALARAGSSRLRLFRDGAGALFLVVRLVVLLNPWRFFLPLAAGLSLLGLPAVARGWLVGGRFSLAGAACRALRRAGLPGGAGGPGPQPPLARAAVAKNYSLDMSTGRPSLRVPSRRKVSASTK